MRIEDYAIIGDTQTVALVSKDASMDWLCIPRLDSGACFAALLGNTGNGRWLIAPVGDIQRTARKYRGKTLVLETELTTSEGTVRVVDCMPVRDNAANVVRIVEGVSGCVRMKMELIIRFDYGRIVPWVRQFEGRLHAIAGPDAVVLETPIETHGQDMTTVAEFDVREGDRIPFVLTWYPSHEATPKGVDPFAAVDQTADWWTEWAERCTYSGRWKDDVVRSLITLKALTYTPTGGIFAAGTTSLPETIGGVRNWDYRFCWLRDATFTLYALLSNGYIEEARAFREWLLRAVAGDPSQLQVLYGVAGERRLDERELEWLEGYEGSRPVRIGNAAANQMQLDIYGEVIDTLYQAHRFGVAPDTYAWRLEHALLNYLEGAWEQPDEGIWEVRGPRRHFTHSKVMAWVAMDRAVKSLEQRGSNGECARWRALRSSIHKDICEKAYDSKRNTFLQSYGSDVVDASLLLLPLVGFLPPEDPRVRGTVAAVERDLLRDGFVMRYPPEHAERIDGLPGVEGAFLACSFWLVDNYVLQGRIDEATKLFTRLLSIRNDVGLLAEEYDVGKRRLVGNFPQAFSHVALANSARNLASKHGPAVERKET